MNWQAVPGPMVDLLALPEVDADRLYAIGDIHGRLDLLLELEALIEDDLKASPAVSPCVCYLGDYIDRGPQSAQVIDHLVRDTYFSRLFLIGNHEERMLAFLDDPEGCGPSWKRYGSAEALASYGITLPPADDWAEVAVRFKAALPAPHLRFLKTLRVAARWKGYLLVHAGIDPTRPLSQQRVEDLYWIREGFADSDCDFGLRVVHGHTIQPEPDVRPNRIGIDTGAHRTGRLTAAVLSPSAAPRFLHT